MNIDTMIKLQIVEALLRYLNAVTKTTALHWAELAGKIEIELEDGQMLVIENSGDIATSVTTLKTRWVATQRVTTSDTPVTGYITGGIAGNIPFSGMLVSTKVVELNVPGHNHFQTNVIELHFNVGGETRTIKINTRTHADYPEHEGCKCQVCRLNNPPTVNVGEVCSVKGPNDAFVPIGSTDVTLTPPPAG